MEPVRWASSGSGPPKLSSVPNRGVAGLVGAVEEVLHPAAPAHITDEDVQLAVRSELDHPAVVIAATGRRRRFALEGWQRPQPDYVLVERQHGAVPHEPVHPVAQ